jgi:hypothetical protein
VITDFRWQERCRAVGCETTAARSPSSPSWRTELFGADNRCQTARLETQFVLSHAHISTLTDHHMINHVDI